MRPRPCWPGMTPVLSSCPEKDSNFDQNFLDLASAVSWLANAIHAGNLKATIRRTAWERGWEEVPGEGERREDHAQRLKSDVSEASGVDPFSVGIGAIIYRVNPDWSKSSVSVDVLKAWLSSRGLRKGFFFPDAAMTDIPGYLDPNHLRYAPKLAAAVRAWQAVTDPNGRSPKQAMDKWLREHAAEFGLSDDEGKPNETGIEEVAKVANWLPGGGAAKTPGG